MDGSAFIEAIACISAATFYLGGGTVLGFSAILIPQLEAADSDIKVTKQDVSWIVSLVPLVIPVSSFITGYLVDKIGRLNTIKVATIPYLTGWVFIAMAQDVNMLVIGRFLTGFSLAAACNPAIVYITEIARPDFRGALLSLAISLSSLGTVLVYAKGAYLHWRTTSWLCMAYCLLPILFITLWSPESPIWLISRGRVQEALKSLTFLHSNDKKAGRAETQLAELLKEHNKEGADQKGSSLGKLLQAFSRSNSLKPLFLVSAILIFQQLSGIYITIFYAVTFIESVGANIDPYTSTVGIGIVRFIMGLITSFLLKNFGRRPLFMLSSMGMAISMLMSGYFTREIAEGNMEKNLLPVICILIYVSVSVIGFINIPWTMTAELFTIEIRGMAQSLMVAVSSITSFGVLKIYPFLGDIVGGGYAVQWLFAGVCFVSVLLLFIFLPETHRKELTEIQEYFTNNTIYILSNRAKRKVTEEEIGDEMVILKDASPSV